jgi:Na+:H+ antiporter
MLTFFELIAALLTTTAVLAWLNIRVLGLPANIGLLTMGLGVSLLLLVIHQVFPAAASYEPLARTIAQIDFYDAFMHGMLALLLFAGALHVDLDRLRERALAVGVLATLGVSISATLVATGLWLAAGMLETNLSFAWAFVFGALIAPTDPVAVLTTLKTVTLPKGLQTDLSAEALLNDGIGVVLFAIALQLALEPSDSISAASVLQDFAVQAGGGALLGLLTGFVAYRAMQAIDEYAVEVTISIALVLGTYAVADRLGLSGPIAVVVAGVLIGNRGVAFAMSDTTKGYVLSFWTLVDEILNAVLFLLIGLEVVVLRFDGSFIGIALIAVPLVLLARFASVAVPVAALKPWMGFVPGTIPVLVWGGIRGGIPVALALALPEGPERPLLLTATYAVVLFSVIAQGLTFGRVVEHFVEVEDPAVSKN